MNLKAVTFRTAFDEPRRKAVAVALISRNNLCVGVLQLYLGKVLAIKVPFMTMQSCAHT